MPSKNPHPTAANHYRTLQLLRLQHTAIHHIISDLEHGGSETEAKRKIAQVIGALATAQAEIK